MALLKCPDCGKTVSSRARTCPECGCPAEYFEASDEKTSDNSQKNTEIQETNNVVEYHIAGNNIICPMGKNSIIAGLLGHFMGYGEFAEQLLLRKYKQAGSLEKVLEIIPKEAQEVFNGIVEQSMKIIFGAGVVMSEDEFFSKYYFQWDMDYEKYYNEVVSIYSDIMQWSDELRGYRELEKASRSQWVGGGFGIKGAIKGAVEASLLNAGTNFLRSFGDRRKERQDEEVIRKALDDVYNSDRAKSLLCHSMNNCIVNLYFALVDELKGIGFIDRDFFEFDHDKADVLYDNTKRFVNDTETFVSNILQCIRLYPGDRRYYSSIIGEIYSELDDSDEYNFYGFLEYWQIGYFFERETVNEEADTNHKRIVTNIENGIKETLIRENENLVLSKMDDEEERKDLIKLLEVKDPGKTLIYASENVIVTDSYFLFKGGRTHDMLKLQQIEFKENKDECFVSTIQELNNNEVYFYEEQYDEISMEELRDVIAIIKLGVFGLQDGQYRREWDEYIEIKDNELKIEKADLPDGVHNLEDYKTYRSFIYENISFPDELEELSEISKKSYDIIMKIVDMDNDDYNIEHGFSSWNIIDNIGIVNWLPQDISPDELCREMINDRLLFKHSYLNDVWILGDPLCESLETLEETDGLTHLIGESSSVYLFKDFSVMGNAKNGFIITDDSLVIMNSSARYPLTDITDIYVDNKRCIVFEINEKAEEVKTNGLTSEWIDERRINHILNYIKLFCVRIGKNEKLDITEKNPQEIEIDPNSLYAKRRELARTTDLIDVYLEKCEYNSNLFNFLGLSESSRIPVINDITVFFDVNGDSYTRRLWTESKFTQTADSFFKTDNNGTWKNPEVYSFIPKEYDIERYTYLMYKIIDFFQESFLFGYILKSEPSIMGGFSHDNENTMKICSPIFEKGEKLLFYHITAGSLFNKNGYAMTNRRFIDLSTKKNLLIKDVIGIEYEEWEYSFTLIGDKEKISFTFYDKMDEKELGYTITKDIIRGVILLFNEIIKRYSDKMNNHIDDNSKTTEINDDNTESEISIQLLNNSFNDPTEIDEYEKKYYAKLALAQTINDVDEYLVKCGYKKEELGELGYSFENQLDVIHDLIAFVDADLSRMHTNSEIYKDSVFIHKNVKIFDVDDNLAWTSPYIFKIIPREYDIERYVLLMYSFVYFLSNFSDFIKTLRYEDNGKEYDKPIKIHEVCTSVLEANEKILFFRLIPGTTSLGYVMTNKRFIDIYSKESILIKDITSVETGHNSKYHVIILTGKTEKELLYLPYKELDPKVDTNMDKSSVLENELLMLFREIVLRGGGNPYAKDARNITSFGNSFLNNAQNMKISDICKIKVTDITNKQLLTDLRFFIIWRPDSYLLYYDRRHKSFVMDNRIRLSSTQHSIEVSNITGIDYESDNYYSPILIKRKQEGGFRTQMYFGNPLVIAAINYAIGYNKAQEIHERLKYSKFSENGCSLDQGAFTVGSVTCNGINGNLVIYKGYLWFDGGSERKERKYQLNQIRKCSVEGDHFIIWSKGKFLQDCYHSSNDQLWVDVINNAMAGKYLTKFSFISDEGLVDGLMSGEDASNIDNLNNEMTKGESINEVIENQLDSLHSASPEQNPLPLENYNKLGDQVLRNTEGKDKEEKNKTDITTDKESKDLSKQDTNNTNEKEKMFCTFCGKKIIRTSKFCTFCGKANKYGGGS